MIKVLAYKGISWVSKAIRWQTRSQYSHIGLLFEDDSVIEAWHRGGVLHVRDYARNHSEGTRVDVYELRDAYYEMIDYDAAIKFLEAQVGMPYDFGAVARFLSRRPASQNKKWFCSELAGEAFRIAGLQLQQLPPHVLSPRDIAMSPLLKHSFTWTV